MVISSSSIGKQITRAPATKKRKRKVEKVAKSRVTKRKSKKNGY
jgi:hypothetical protein